MGAPKELCGSAVPRRVDCVFEQTKERTAGVSWPLTLISPCLEEQNSVMRLCDFEVCPKYQWSC